MAEQLTGVLREVLSAEDGRPRPAPSPLFGPEQHTAGAEIVDTLDTATILAPLEPPAAAAALPVPLVSAFDPAAAFLAGLTARDPEDLAAALASAPVASHEVRLALLRVRIELGDLDPAARLLEEIATEAPDDWRVDWYRGVRALACGRASEAVGVFTDLYDLAPGEQAPKLALAFCFETLDDMGNASYFYETVWRTDPTHVSAAFGLARSYLAAGDRAAAERVLDSVPASPATTSPRSSPPSRPPSGAAAPASWTPPRSSRRAATRVAAPGHRARRRVHRRGPGGRARLAARRPHSDPGRVPAADPRHGPGRTGPPRQAGGDLPRPRQARRRRRTPARDGEARQRRPPEDALLIMSTDREHGHRRERGR